MLRVVEPPAVTEMMAEADAVESATLVAVTVALVATLVVGAVNRPLVDTVPALALQRTCWLMVLAAVVVAELPVLTEAVSCCVPAEGTVAVAGVTVTVVLELAGVTEMTAEADAVGSATLVAVTVAAMATLVVGAVNMPLVETVPALALHRTCWLTVLAAVVVPELPAVTDAVSCCAPAEATAAVAGVTVTVRLDCLLATVSRIPRSA